MRTTRTLPETLNHRVSLFATIRRKTSTTVIARRNLREKPQEDTIEDTHDTPWRVFVRNREMADLCQVRAGCGGARGQQRRTFGAGERRVPPHRSVRSVAPITLEHVLFCNLLVLLQRPTLGAGEKLPGLAGVSAPAMVLETSQRQQLPGPLLGITSAKTGDE